MHIDGLVFGVLHHPAIVGDREFAERLRSFTVSWSRYGYHGPIYEAADLDSLVEAAATDGHSALFVQVIGQVIAERWRPEHWQQDDFPTALRRVVEDEENVLVVNKNATRLVVNLRRHNDANGQTPRTDLDDALDGHMLDLTDGGPAAEAAFKAELGEAILRFHPGQANEKLTADQRAFLTTAASQAQRVHRGVFVWNLEPYDDIEEPATDFAGPVQSLYSVGAGFKPNRILQTHGFDERTRVVYFDYSQRALDFRRLLLDGWDGRNYPAFLKRAFAALPADTFWHLWNDLTPDQIDWADMDRFWQRELDRWGGADGLAEHWTRYRNLPHEFVRVDILNEPERLFEQISRDRGSIIWWSNAFFTVFSNWFLTCDQRRERYDRWVDGLAAANSDLHLVGADYNNTSVNDIRVADYKEGYWARGRDYLKPVKFARREIRF